VTELGERLRAVLGVDPAAPCLEFDGVWRSWGDVAAEAHGLDAELAAAGIGPGHAVAVVMRNHPATVAALVCAVTAERPLLVLPSYLPTDALDAAIAARRPGPVVVDPGAGLRAGAGRSARLAGVAVELLTSGTTGPPKRVPLTVERLTHVLGGPAEARLRDGVRIVWAPLAHIGGLWGVLQSLVEGRRLSLMTRFEPDGWVERVRRHRPRFTGLPPAGLRMLLDADVDPADLACLLAVTTGTAPASGELVAAFEDRFGVPVLVTYGATEFAGAVASWSLADHARFATTKRGSVGRAHPGVELRVVDPLTFEVLAPGRAGLLELRGGQLGDEWMRTSDLAHVDGDGFLFIDGRADDVIVRGGFKVSAGTVAGVLEQHPFVAAAGVVGVPDARLGEVPVAVIEARAGGDPPGGTELEAFLRARLPAHQVPVAFHVVERLPRTATLKVDAEALDQLARAARR
jgi:long-chain acyl-CoA synthetase